MVLFGVLSAFWPNVVIALQGSAIVVVCRLSPSSMTRVYHDKTTEAQIVVLSLKEK